MKRISLLLLSMAAVSSLQAQYLEAGTMIGASNYAGELSEQRLSTAGFNTLLGIYGKYNADKYFSIKAALSKGMLSGDDANAKTLENRERNLSFRSDLLELAVTGEVNFSAYNIRDRKTGMPYFFTGLALVHFNPQAQMRGSWYDLQPLKTEGKHYSRTTIAVPFGLGLKFNLSYKVNFGLEMGARKTFSDYLDDVSTIYPDILELRKAQPMSALLSYRTPELTGEFGENPVGADRGDSSNDDWYFFAGITVSVNLADKYGIDFDKKYDLFKEEAKAKEQAKKVKPQPAPKKVKPKRKWRLFHKREMLQPQAKKRTK
jgi:hypothetical protein